MAAKKKRALTPEEQLEAALVLEEEWPYKLPDNWCWIRLLDSFVNKTDSKKKIPQKQYRDYGDIAIVDQGESLIGGYTNDSELQYAGELPVIVFGDHTRRLKFVDFPFAQGADGVKVLLPKPFIDPKFFFYALHNTNIPNLGYRRHFPLFKSFCIPLPPLSEQRLIVQRVEFFFSKLDDAEAELREVIDGSEQRRAAILHNAFSGELTAQWRNENKKLFSSWTRHAFRDLGTTKLGKMLDKAKNTGDEVPYLRNINVRWFDFDLSDVATMRVSEEEKSALQVKPGDLFICEGGEPGRCAVWQGDEADLVYQKALHRFRPKDGVLSEFVAYNIYYLSLSDELEKLFTGTTIKHLTGKSLAKMQLVLPSLEEQTEIVNCLNRLLGQESEAIGAANDALVCISSLRSAVLSKALRGELGTNDPGEASSKELLASIMSGNAGK